MTDVVVPGLLSNESLAEAMTALGSVDLPQVSRVPTTLESPTTIGVGADALRPLLEHSLLKATATAADIDRLCDEAVGHRLGAVCVNPVWVRRASARLHNHPVRVVTVVGFPLGATPTTNKVREAQVALIDGADELDMVANLAALREGDFRGFYEDIRAVVRTVDSAPVKVIIEAGLLVRREKILASVIAARAGASFVKTSTGFAFAERAGGLYAPLGATVDDVALLRAVLGDDIGVKAAGGIKTAEQAVALVAAGANRLGTSASLRIVGGD